MKTERHLSSLLLKMMIIILAFCFLADLLPTAALNQYSVPRTMEKNERDDIDAAWMGDLATSSSSPKIADALGESENDPGPSGPGWHNITIDTPITPEQARVARLSGQASVDMLLATNGLPTSETEATPEIEALARALQYDPKLIFDYVHNHIDYVPLYGSLNGASGSLLAGRGTDADQASLFIALMYASGFSANYVVGDVQYDASRLANWVGVEEDQVGYVFANGAIPLTGIPGGFEITRIWAEAIISDTTYTFDPAMKEFQETDGISDLESALGYNRSDFLSNAQIGATITSSYTLNLNETNIRADLVDYAMNLVDYIDTNLPDDGLEELIGGREIVQVEMVNYSTALPYALSTSVDSRPSDLAGYRHTLRVQHASIDETFGTFQIAAKRMTIYYDGPSSAPILRVDGAAIVTSTVAASGPMTITVDHPYAPGYEALDQTATFNLTSNGSYAIIHDFNTASPDLIANRNQLLARYRQEGLADISESVQGESLWLMGLAWHHQVNLFSDLVGRVGNTLILQHHQVGVMGYEGGVFIDVPLGMNSLVSRNGTSDTVAAFRVRTMMSSAFEHGVLEQLQNTTAVSTIKLLQVNNDQSDKTFLVDSSNWSKVEPQLQNYSASQKAFIAAGIAAGHDYVLPEDAHITLGQWRGVGFIDDYEFGRQFSFGRHLSGNP